jgi:hypothetical protein
MPEVSAIHIDAALTNLSVAYPTNNLISERLFPDVPVLKQSDKYYICDATRRAIAPTDTRRAPGTAAHEVDFDWTTGQYMCEGHALASVIPDEERANADPVIKPELDKTEFITEQVLTGQEIDCKAKLDASLTGAMTSNPAGKWDDPVNGDPYADITLAINAIEDATGMQPNVMAMDIKVLRNGLKNHPDILDRIKYTGTSMAPAVVTPQAIAELFELEEVILATAFKNTAVEGQAAAITRIWGSDVYLAYRAPRPGLKQISLGYRMVWSPFSGAVRGWQVNKARLDLRHSDWIEISKYYDQKIVTATAGYRLQARLT